MAKDLLLEIGTEEIPARFMTPALRQMQELAEKALHEAKLSFSSLKVLGTPRRLTLIVGGLAEMQPDTVVEAKGPSKEAAYDNDGKPTKALEGFCRSKGITPKETIEREVGKTTYLFACKKEKGLPAETILPALLTEIINKIYFPKPMRWGYEEMRFARPVRWLVALWGNDVLPLSIAQVTAGRESRGHRFLGSDKVNIANAAGYEGALAQEYVIADQEKRRKMCQEEINRVAKEAGGIVKEDKELLEEVTYLLEYPTALLGSFDESYLTIPQELVVTPMREHQRYFPLYGKDGNLMNNFIAVRNGTSDHLDVVQAGNEKVLAARLSDAKFFWQEDCKKPLFENIPKLKTIVFHEKLGTLYAKVERLNKLALLVAQKLGYDNYEIGDTLKAAALCKCDLLTSAVYEFTELQGIMGKYYAAKCGEEEEVCKAIEEHYLPRHAGDELPGTKAGIVLAIVDRLDNLTGFFGQNMIPTGSQDPYALRRQATGMAQIIIRSGLELSLSKLVEAAYQLYQEQTVTMELSLNELQDKISSFLKQRLQNMLTEEGISYDIANAVLANSCDNLYQSYNKALAITAFRLTPDFNELMTGFTRAANILKNNPIDSLPNAALLSQDAEKALYEGLQKAQAVVKECLAKEDYPGALAALGSLRPQIDAFFDAILVMDQDPAIRDNRLSLLKQFVSLSADIGSLTELVLA